MVKMETIRTLDDRENLRFQKIEYMLDSVNFDQFWLDTYLNLRTQREKGIYLVILALFRGQ